jgi:hypothetical protein
MNYKKFRIVWYNAAGESRLPTTLSALPIYTFLSDYMSHSITGKLFVVPTAGWAKQQSVFIVQVDGSDRIYGYVKN